MAANQYRLNVTANNLANVDTVGFKHDLALLTERPVESREDAASAKYHNVFYDRLSGGTLVAPSLHSFGQGPTLVTNGRLDAMINGNGFFQVQTPDGIQFTRDGRFVVDSEGTLVTATGAQPVLSAGGASISVPEGQPPYVDQQGRIRQGNSFVGQLGVVEFDDVHHLRKVGGNRYIATAGASPRPAASSSIVPGHLEGSIVDPVNGIAKMIEISRGFEMNANLLRMQDQMLGRAVNDIARA